MWALAGVHGRIRSSVHDVSSMINHLLSVKVQDPSPASGNARPMSKAMMAAAAKSRGAVASPDAGAVQPAPAKDAEGGQQSGAAAEVRPALAFSDGPRV